MQRFRQVCLATALIWSAGAASAQEMKAEVIHWWTSGGESAAVKVFADQFTKAGGTWIDTAIAGGENARTAGINRIVGGNPPTAMQFNTGKQFDELVGNGLLRDVEEVAAGRQVARGPAGGDRRGDDPRRQVLRRAGQHPRPELAVVQHAGARECRRRAADDLRRRCSRSAKLKAAGLIPLAFRAASPGSATCSTRSWSARAAPSCISTVLRQQEHRRGQERRSSSKVAETFAKLRGLVDAGSPGRNWNDATTLVITGKAGMQIMGDWAKGEFIAAGQTAGKEYGCTILAARPAAT